MGVMHHLPPEDLVAAEDGVGGERGARIGAHLAGCPVCRQRLHEFADVGRLLRERFPVGDDPTARARIMAEIEALADQRKG